MLILNLSLSLPEGIWDTGTLEEGVMRQKLSILAPSLDAGFGVNQTVHIIKNTALLFLWWLHPSLQQSLDALGRQEGNRRHNNPKLHRNGIKSTMLMFWISRMRTQSDLTVSSFNQPTQVSLQQVESCADSEPHSKSD